MYTQNINSTYSNIYVCIYTRIYVRIYRMHIYVYSICQYAAPQTYIHILCTNMSV